LQRLNTALQCDLEKYTTWAAATGVDELTARLKALQDMLYQQKESTSVETIAKSAAQIRSLTLELTQKTTLIDQLKNEILNSGKDVKVKRDEELTGYLSGIIKEKDALIKQKEFELLQAKVSYISPVLRLHHFNSRKKRS